MSFCNQLSINIERSYSHRLIPHIITGSEESDLPGSGSTGFRDLPTEICLQIFSFLLPKEAITYRLVNHRWKNLLEDDQLWRRYGTLDLEEIENILLKNGIDPESLTTAEKSYCVVYLLTGLLTKEHVDAFPKQYHLTCYISDQARPLVKSGALTAEQVAVFPSHYLLACFINDETRPLVRSGALTATQTAAFSSGFALKDYLKNHKPVEQES